MKQTDQSNSFSDTIDVQTGINEMMQVPEFINAFGVIFKDEMIIHKSDRANSIRLKNISNIAFIKNRKRHLELFCFCLSGILIFNIINYENPLLFNLFLSLMSLLLLFLGVFFFNFSNTN